MYSLVEIGSSGVALGGGLLHEAVQVGLVQLCQRGVDLLAGGLLRRHALVGVVPFGGVLDQPAKKKEKERK